MSKKETSGHRVGNDLATATTRLTKITTQVEGKGTCKNREQIVVLTSRAAPFLDAVRHLLLDWEQMSHKKSIYF